MNAVGIDVSKGKSTVAILRPFGEIVASPFEVMHTASELGKLASLLKSLNGETKVVMECTGVYYLPIANALRVAAPYANCFRAEKRAKGKPLRGGSFSAKIPRDFRGIARRQARKRKTDKADARKIANYGLMNWLDLTEYVPEDTIRQELKTFSRQYNKYNKIQTMLKNNLISLLDRSFPGLRELFTSPARESDGHEKWLDFAARFWHCECVSALSLKAFNETYRKWCKRNGYHCVNAEGIHAAARGCAPVVPKDETTKLLITHAAAQVNAVGESLATVSREMKRLAQTLPEYAVVIEFRGVGEILAPQLMAEIGDVTRFPRKQSLVCFAGMEPENEQSGKFQANGRLSKKGSPHLRKALFQVMDCLLKHSPANDPVYQFLDRKRAEGKHYYSYMNAGAAKFLRIYYARVKEYLAELQKAA
jgi:transposase